jgi:hypothetical protein
MPPVRGGEGKGSWEEQEARLSGENIVERENVERWEV